jgi:hypothetical protein
VVHEQGKAALTERGIPESGGRGLQELLEALSLFRMEPVERLPEDRLNATSRSANELSRGSSEAISRYPV